jgi:hypothetical protein
MGSIHYCGLDCSLENGQGRGRNLVIRRESIPVSRDELSKLELRMLERSAIPHVLQLDIEDVDSEVKLIYKLPLGRSMERFIRDASDASLGGSLGVILELLHSILSILEESRNYMLDEGKYALHPGMIQVGRDSGDLYLAYLPLRTIDNKCSVRQELYQLTLFILDESGVSRDSCPLLLDCLRSSLFDLAEFKLLLIRLQADAITAAGNISPLCAAAEAKEPIRQDFGRDAAGSKPAGHPASSEQNFITSAPAPSSSQYHTAYPKEERLLHDGDTMRFHPNMGSIFRSARLRILLIVIVLIWGAAAWRPSEMMFSLAIGLTLISTALYYKWSRKEKETSWEGEAVDPLFDDTSCHSVSDDQTGLPLQGVHTAHQPCGMAGRAFGWSEAERKLYADTPANTVFLMQPAETELLAPETELLRTQAVLEYQASGTDCLIVELNKGHFVFGRSPVDSDWVLEASGISRKHGAFIQEGMDWSLIDLESKNGCRLNGEILEPKRAYRLKDGDQITAAQSQFVFRVP